MEIQTKFHGHIDISGKQLLNFKQGIPGFEQFTQYVILDLFDNSMLKVLQSIEESFVAFIICDPWVYESEYEFDLNESVIKELEIESSENLEIYNILTIPEDISKATINLLAPVIIHRKHNVGMQVVLEGTSYTTKHSIRIEG